MRIKASAVQKKQTDVRIPKFKGIDEALAAPIPEAVERFSRMGLNMFILLEGKRVRKGEKRFSACLEPVK